MNLKSKYIIYNYSDLEEYFIGKYLESAIRILDKMKQGDIIELHFSPIIMTIEKQENLATFVLKNKKGE